MLFYEESRLGIRYNNSMSQTWKRSKFYKLSNIIKYFARLFFINTMKIIISLNLESYISNDTRFYCLARIKMNIFNTLTIRNKMSENKTNQVSYGINKTK